MRIVVLGAGVVGVTAAWYLAEDGHEVTVLDRQDGPAQETSLANGGQISADHAGPWAGPGAPRAILRWLGREDAPLLFRLRADLAQWRWGLAFLRECTAVRHHENTLALVRLAHYSRDCLRALRESTGIAYDAVTRGILEFHLDGAGFEAARAEAGRMQAYGCDRVARSADECIALEPALAPLRGRLAGGIHTPADESGDAHVFTVKLAGLAKARGVRFVFGATVDAILAAGDRVDGVRATVNGEPGTFGADAYVVALGSGAPRALAPIGVRCPVYPVKGYSATLDIRDPASAWTVSLTDPAHKLVFSRLGSRLRIAGTAELNGWNTELNGVRCRALVERTFALFPDAAVRGSERFWTGLRPATPSNRPLIGRTRYRNLLLDTGHGTLGWTLACGSGRALADIVAGRTPEPDFGFLGAGTPA
jgi:D-amino-acid dehydrogenase